MAAKRTKPVAPIKANKFKKTEKRQAIRSADNSMIRTSVGFPPEIYRTLAKIAEQQKVSVGWIVRDAVEKYVIDRWPLLSPRA